MITESPNVSIIIPAWNEESVLPEMLKCLLGVDYPPSEMQIILAAGGDDQTYEIARDFLKEFGSKFKINVAKQKPEGKNAAIRDGLKLAEGDVIVLLDADTLVTPQWLKKLVEPIIKGEATATNGDYLPVTRNYVSVHYVIEKIKSRIIDHQHGAYGGGSIAIKKSVLNGREDYFFNKEVYIGVDFYLGERLKESGCFIKLVEGADVKTYMPSKISEFISVERRWMLAWMGFLLNELKKNFSLSNARPIISNIVIVFSFFGLFTCLVNKYLFLFSLILFSIFLIKITLRLIQVASYEKKSGYLIYLPSYLALSFMFQVIFFTSFISNVFGFRKKQIHFKGPRPEVYK